MLVQDYLIEEILEMMDDADVGIEELIRRPVGQPLVIEVKEVPLRKAPETVKVRN